MFSLNELSSFPARYFHPLASGKIQCDLCPRHCKLADGQDGFCFVRSRLGDKIVLKTYGRSTGFAVDPIEKKPLNHFLPGTKILSFGTAGCNLSCKFCQNWDISKSKENSKLAVTASPFQVALAAKQLGCPSVAFTYNDPIIFLEYAMDTALSCKELGIKTVAVTSGYICPGPRADMFSLMDAANVDLKSFSEDFYRSICSAHLKPVLDTLAFIKEKTSTWLEITTLLIPGFNDNDVEIKALSKWILENLGQDVPLHFSAFHPAYKMLDVEPTPLETLLKARDIALDTGLNYVYTGNILHTASSSTTCPKCGKLLIERSWHKVVSCEVLPEGKCPCCGFTIAGHFS